MALHSKWSSGDLIFYDGTQDIMTIKNGTDGVEFDVNITMGDGDPINFGASDDIAMSWTTGGVFEVLPDAANSDMYLGSTAKPLDVVNYGNIKYRAPASPTSTGANITLTSTSNRVQFIANATTGDSPVLLPASTSSNAGDQYTIFQTSTGGGSVIVYNGATGGATVATIALTEGAIMISNGTVWRAIVGPET